MKILMSIKPKYVAKIMSGEKKFEFRKKIWTVGHGERSTIVVYSSNPTKKVVGEFDVPHILFFYSPQTKENVWEIVKEYAGITREEFDNYFANSKRGCAIRIGNFKRYDKEYDLQEKYPNIKRPPQNFCYLEN